MEIKKRHITDSETLKAMAHPLRIAIMEALGATGPMTASQVAEVMGESPSNCSWHLRKLAEHGFVEEAPGGKGRNRPWRVVVESHVWDDDDADPATRRAGNALTDALLDRELQRLRAARDLAEAPEWREATSVNQSQLWLTADEARELGERLRELFVSHVDRHQDASSRPAGARLVSLVGWIVPSAPVGDAKADEAGRQKPGSTTDRDAAARHTEKGDHR